MPKTKARYFMGITRSGTLIEDNKAYEVDEELMTDNEDQRMAFDDDRMVPYYRLLEEGLPPQLIGYVQLHTGGAVPVSRDARWHLEKSPAIYYAAANSLTVRRNAGLLSNRKMGMFILVAGIIMSCFFLLLMAMSPSGEPDPATGSEAASAAAPETSQPPESAPETGGPGGTEADPPREQPPADVIDITPPGG